MLTHLSILIGPLLLWACSTDPGEIGGISQGPESQRTADINREKEHEGLVDNDRNSDNSVSSGEDVGVGPRSPAERPKGESPPVDAAPRPAKSKDVEEAKVTPPHIIAGAFLVGEVIPDEGGETGVKVGIVAKQDDRRLAHEPERYALTWSLAVNETLEGSVRLLPTKHPSYDRVLEYDGSMEEFKGNGSLFSVQLKLSAADGEAELESILKFNFDSLFRPRPAVD